MEPRQLLHFWMNKKGLIWLGLAISALIYVATTRSAPQVVRAKDAAQDVSDDDDVRTTWLSADLLPNQVSDQPNPLDNCYHVYLDVGSNVGIQVRKLYEPHLYKGAAVLKLFDQHFGPDRNLSQVCAVGFEPNPAHTPRLKEVEDAYQACGWNVRFFTETAAGDEDEKNVPLFSDMAEEYKEWGASVVEKNNNWKKKVGQVEMKRLADYVLNVVATRRLPEDLQGHQLPPAVLMKMDIEGSEVEVMTDLVLSGATQYITLIMIEFHPHLTTDKQRKALAEDLATGLKAMTVISKGKLGLSEVDDESFGFSEAKFPKCHK